VCVCGGGGGMVVAVGVWGVYGRGCIGRGLGCVGWKLAQEGLVGAARYSSMLARLRGGRGVLSRCISRSGAARDVRTIWKYCRSSRTLLQPSCRSSARWQMVAKLGIWCKDAGWPLSLALLEPVRSSEVELRNLRKEHACVWHLRLPETHTRRMMAQHCSSQWM
jgi:hypothetical protein